MIFFPLTDHYLKSKMKRRPARPHTRHHRHKQRACLSPAHHSKIKWRTEGIAISLEKVGAVLCATIAWVGKQLPFYLNLVRSFKGTPGGALRHRD